MAIQKSVGTETLADAGGQGLSGMLNDIIDGIETGSDPGHTHTLAEGATDVTSSYAELNILDGCTATHTQLNYLNAATGTTGTATTNLVFSTSPTLVTPTLGVATVTSVNKVTITAPATSATLTIAQGSSLITSGAYAITLTSTAATNVTLPITGTLSTLAGTETLTNKRITPRVTAIVSHATPTINTDNCDFVDITALAAAITSMTTNLSGTPTNGQKLIIRFKDDGTARAITWGASFEACGTALPTTTTLGKRLTVGFLYDTTTSKWGCVASIDET